MTHLWRIRNGLPQCLLDNRDDPCYHAAMNKKQRRETVGVWISRPIHRRLKIEAAKRDSELRNMVEEALEQYLVEEGDKE